MLVKDKNLRRALSDFGKLEYSRRALGLVVFIIAGNQLNDRFAHRMMESEQAI